MVKDDTPGGGVSQMLGGIPGIGGFGRTAIVGELGRGEEVGMAMEESGKRVVALLSFTKEWFGEDGRGRESLVC